MRQFALATILALGTTAAFADAPFAPMPEPSPNEGPAFSEYSATRLSGDQVQLTLTFEGGACQAVDEPVLGEVSGDTLAVSIPTHDTSEMCTMQIVQIPVDVTISADSAVSVLDVTVLAPNGEPQVSGPISISQ
ncbi:hypothetical protein GCM10007913_19760 [Devosia yakushimensis]|uniref:Secreted protein n=1 Tax=Devosia yakushimensis TaxID=470028 RepID=A0ABQ5UFW9_9HYPH|nr:hypothetical protein [Devosia yakushimensis]GLQ10044.1 hypothetical protein GCM10007913_19760 [Devosia yakushimensis]